MTNTKVTSSDPPSLRRTMTEKKGRGFFWHLKAAAKRVASTAMSEEKRVASAEEGISSTRQIDSL